MKVQGQVTGEGHYKLRFKAEELEWADEYTGTNHNHLIPSKVRMAVTTLRVR